MCTKSEECDAGEQCYRYRCTKPEGPAPSLLSGKPAATQAAPAPAPNVTAAELRAIRRELEIVRDQQTRILELLETKKPAPAKVATPTPKTP